MRELTIQLKYCLRGLTQIVLNHIIKQIFVNLYYHLSIHQFNFQIVLVRYVFIFIYIIKKK